MTAKPECWDTSDANIPVTPTQLLVDKIANGVLSTLALSFVRENLVPPQFTAAIG